MKPFTFADLEKAVKDLPKEYSASRWPDDYPETCRLAEGILPSESGNVPLTQKSPPSQ